MTNNRWRQFIAIRGIALLVVESFSNIPIADRSNTVILRGDGDYFPEMRGADWAAMCAPRVAADVALDDLRPILMALIFNAPLAVSDASREEIETFLRGAG